MKITFEGRDWTFDEDQITVKQGIAIHLAYGFTVSAWLEELAKLDARAVQVTYWLMLQQNGIVKPIADCDCSLVQFMQAYTEARQAELERDTAAAAEQIAAEAAAPVPTSPPPGDQAWSGPGYQTVMTPQPIEQQYLPQHGPTGWSPSP